MYTEVSNGICVSKAIPIIRKAMQDSTAAMMTRSTIMCDNKQMYTDRGGTMFLMFTEMLYDKHSKKPDLPCRCDMSAVKFITDFRRKVHNAYEHGNALVRPSMQDLHDYIDKCEENNIPWGDYSTYCFTDNGPRLPITKLMDWLDVFREAEIIEIHDKNNPSNQGIKLEDHHGNIGIIMGIMHNGQKATDLTKLPEPKDKDDHHIPENRL